MYYDGRLIGRQAEREIIASALANSEAGSGQLLLLGGEAGVGKTRLAEDSLSRSKSQFYKVACQEGTTPAYGPIVTLLRQFCRATGADFSSCGPLAPYLSLLMPELGSEPEDAGDQATLLEALLCAATGLASERPVVVVLDDLQWADNATLEILPSFAAVLPQHPIMWLGIYRSDEVPRGHPMRRLRNELRRSRQLQELNLGPLNYIEVKLLAEAILDAEVDPVLARTLFERTDGLPLFVEELIGALRSSGRLLTGDRGLHLAEGDGLPLPESIRDAVLIRLDGLSVEARGFAEAASVIGDQFELDLAVALSGSADGLGSLIEGGIVSEFSAGRAGFRHALTREAIYNEILWTRRKSLHRQLARILSERGEAPEVVADHWRAAQEFDHARRALVRAADEACHIHAYRDAAAFGRRALEMWPEGQEEPDRLAVLDRLGNCFQLSGQLADATQTWREVAEGRREAGQIMGYAETQRRLAGLFVLRGAWSQASTARNEAADAFQEAGMQAEAASEYMALALMSHNDGRFSPALIYSEQAEELARSAGRLDLLAQSKGWAGMLLGKLGKIEEGLAQAREGLTLALDYNLVGIAAEIYQRVGSVLEQGNDLKGSLLAYREAAAYCKSQGEDQIGQVCRGCLSGLLVNLGQWDEALSTAQAVVASEDTPEWMQIAAETIIGRVFAFRGEVKEGRAFLSEGLSKARRLNLFNSILFSEWSLAVAASYEGRDEEAAFHWRRAWEIWEQSEDIRFGLPILRWGATFFADRDLGEEVRSCAAALSRVVSVAADAESLAALAHALGESSLLDGQPEVAVEQFSRAVELLGSLELPYGLAESQWRLGVALIAAGEGGRALASLADAHKIAERLGARPLMDSIADTMSDPSLKEHSVKDRRVSRIKQGGLTGRQVEVLGHLAQGLTNKEIAEQLVLSPRTVEMHVANILNKLGCNNRAEAVARAAELGLLA